MRRDSLRRRVASRRGVGDIGIALLVVLCGVGLVVVAGGNGATTARNADPKQASRLGIRDGHQCSFGDGARLWVSEIEGTGVRQVTFRLHWIARGQVQEVASGSYTRLRGQFQARAYVMLGAVPESEMRAEPRIDMGAVFLPGRPTGSWERRAVRLPTGLRPVRQMWLTSPKVAAGKASPLCTIVLAPETKDPGAEFVWHRPINEWRALTKDRPEAVLVAEVLIEE